MTATGLAKEAILGVMMEREFDIRSPYGLYDYPRMWNLFERDGITTAVRPAITQNRVNFQMVEEPGIGWGRHRDGVWIAGEQHRISDWDHFVEKVLIPEIGAGAVLTDPERFSDLFPDRPGDEPEAEEGPGL